MPTFGARCVDCELKARKVAVEVVGSPTKVAGSKTWPCIGGCGKGMLAPGAKCPDCILAARRALELAHPAAAAPADDVTSEAARAKTPEEAQARDRAILDRLKTGPASFEQLAAVLPGDFPSPWAREKACRSAVIRMKAKAQLKIVQEGYAVA